MTNPTTTSPLSMDATAASAWLRPVALVLVAFGIATMLGTIPALEFPTRLLFDAAFWPLDGRETLAARETRLALAIGGGLTVGLGAMIYVVADRVLPRDYAAGRAVILAGLLSWFCVDSLGSVLAGAPANVLLNVPFLLAVAWPFWRSANSARRGA